MNQLTKKQGTEVGQAMDLSGWENEEISSSDIIIPSILAMQGLSEFVTDGKAKFGDFVNSLTEEVVGSISKPFEFIPFYLDKTLKISKEINGKYELDRVEKLTPANENLPWEDVEAGAKIKREKVYTAFGIIPGSPLPCLIRFKGKSVKTGKKLATQMYAINMTTKKLPPCASVMSISGKKEQNDKGTFVVLDASVKGESTKEQIAECAKWISIVKQGAVKVHEEDEKTTEETSTFSEANTQF